MPAFIRPNPYSSAASISIYLLCPVAWIQSLMVDWCVLFVGGKLGMVGFLEMRNSFLYAEVDAGRRKRDLIPEFYVENI